MVQRGCVKEPGVKFKVFIWRGSEDGKKVAEAIPGPTFRD
jgi:hypothetical protein